MCENDFILRACGYAFGLRNFSPNVLPPFDSPQTLPMARAHRSIRRNLKYPGKEFYRGQMPTGKQRRKNLNQKPIAMGTATVITAGTGIAAQMETRTGMQEYIKRTRRINNLPLP
jgi:hypothetical protein